MLIGHDLRRTGGPIPGVHMMFCRRESSLMEEKETESVVS